MNLAITTSDLLAWLRTAGVTITPAIDLEGPAHILTDATLQHVRDHKPAMLALLVHPARVVAPVTTTGGTRGSLLADVLDVFPEAQVVHITTKPTRPGETCLGLASDMSDANLYRITATANPQHQRVLELLADVFDRDPRKAQDLIDAWHERIAITTLDGHLTIGEAEAIAWEEISQAVAQNNK